MRVCVVVCRWTWKFNRMHRNAMQCACGSVYCICTPNESIRLHVVVIQSVYSFIKQILSPHCIYVQFFFIDAIICCYHQRKFNTHIELTVSFLLNWIFNSILFGQIAIYKHVHMGFGIFCAVSHNVFSFFPHSSW